MERLPDDGKTYKVLQVIFALHTNIHSSCRTEQSKAEQEAVFMA